MFLFGLTVLFLALCLSQRREAERLLPRGTEYAAAHITFTDLALAGTEIPDTVLAGRRDSVGIVGTGKPGGETAEARIVLVNRAYFDMQPLPIIQGAVPDDLRNGPFALIGDDLARRLFLTLDCIGYPFSIDGQTVAVAGIYEESRSLLSRISSDGRKLVFLLAGPEAADSLPERVFLCGSDGNNVPEETFFQLNAVLRDGLNANTARDWDAVREELAQLTRFLFFLYRLVTAVFLLRTGFPFLRSFPAWFRESGEGDTRTIRAVLRRLLPPVFCIAAAVILLLSFRVRIIIPPGWFPDGNRLPDLRYCTEIFVNGFTKRNIKTYSHAESLRYFAVRSICFSGFGALLSLFRVLDLLRHCRRNDS